MWYYKNTWYNWYRYIVNYKKQHYPNMLRVIRQNSGYTQRRIAKLLGHKTAATLCDWENEVTRPSITNLFKLCIIYNKTPRELYPDYYNHIAQRLHDSNLL